MTETLSSPQTRTLEEVFHDEMLGLYEKAKNECGYHANRFRQEVTEEGGLAVARERLSGNAPRNALYKLHKLNRLDICLESLVLRREFRELFTDAELDRARQRLGSLSYCYEKSL
jgi:hypothetical protein